MTINFVLFFALATTAFTHGIIYMGGVTLPIDANGAYKRVSEQYNDAAVYKRTDSLGHVWSIYRRHDGLWHLDSNDMSEDWDGTVASTRQYSPVPYGVRWNLDAHACTADGFFQVRGLHHISEANGKFVFDKMTLNGEPVYQHTAGGGTWSLYKRSDGHWYITLNQVTDRMIGSIATTLDRTDDPVNAHWTSGTVSRYGTVYIRGAPHPAETDGSYTLSDKVYNGSPVYQHADWSLYKRRDGFWYIDQGAVDESSSTSVDSSISQGPDPTLLHFSFAAVTGYQTVQVAGMPYAQITDGDYVLAETPINKSPVYSFNNAGYTFSVYQRKDGKWYHTFNYLGEDWGNTLSFSTTPGGDPSALEWNSGVVNGIL